MDLPTPPLPVDLDRVRELIDAILDHPGGRGAVPVVLLDHFTALTGRGWPEPAWRGVTSRADFARWAATPTERPAPWLSEPQVLEMIRLLQLGDLEHPTLCYWIDLLSDQLGDPRFAELVFWPVRRMRPREVMIAAMRRWRGVGLEDPGFPEWLLSDPETWALSWEWIGAPVPPRTCRAA